MVLRIYEQAWRPASAVIRRSDAQAAHEVTVALLRRADRLPGMEPLARWVNHATLPQRPTLVGGVTLPHPLIVAAGLVKGDGFPDEATALSAVRERRNVIPGWRTMAALLGAVELGSFTRYPRTGNSGRVVWRDDATHSMQNRIGLRNPGAVAAAASLSSKGRALPRVWGVNLAVSPGLGDSKRAADDIDAAAAEFTRAFAGHPRPPAWYTLNLSCPNTEDDPQALQTDELARRLGAALVDRVEGTPVWAKVGPELSATQYSTLARAFADSGVRAVIATNTLARPAPGRDAPAGVSGAGLRSRALDAVAQLSRAIAGGGWDLDVIACGGIEHGADLVASMRAGARAAMLYSALVFRGPLAPALILREAEAAEEARQPRKQAGMTDSETERNVARALLAAGAVTLTPDEPVTFKSGLVSPVYVDSRRLIFDVAAWHVVIEAFGARLGAPAENDGGSAPDVIAGVETAGIPHSSSLAYSLRLPCVFVRKTAKGHGLQRRIEGGDVTARRVVLVEDMVTTGGSSLSAVQALRDEGAVVDECLAIITYGFAAMTEAFEAAGVHLRVLTTFSVVVDEAVGSGRMDERAAILVRDWLAHAHGGEPDGRGPS